MHDGRHENSIVERNEYKIVSRVTRRFCRSRKKLNQVNERVIMMQQSNSHEKKLSYVGKKNEIAKHNEANSTFECKLEK